MASVVIGGIIKCGGGVGFKIIFPDKKKANHYKDMIRWILLDDEFKVISKTGYYDDLGE